MTTAMFTSGVVVTGADDGHDLEREAAGLLVLVEVGGVDGVERPDEAEDPQEDPPQQVVAEPQAQPGALRRHPLVHERQRRPRRRGHRARRGQQRRAGAPRAHGGRRAPGVPRVAAPHPLAPRPQLRQPCGRRRGRDQLACTMHGCKRERAKMTGQPNRT